jgi:hypothetical protein
VSVGAETAGRRDASVVFERAETGARKNGVSRIPAQHVSRVLGRRNICRRERADRYRLPWGGVSNYRSAGRGAQAVA